MANLETVRFDIGSTSEDLISLIRESKSAIQQILDLEARIAAINLEVSEKMSKLIRLQQTADGMTPETLSFVGFGSDGFDINAVPESVEILVDSEEEYGAELRNAVMEGVRL